MEYKIIEKVECGGSDRLFYRCIKENRTYILVWDRDIKTLMKIQKHLADRGIGVPDIHWADENSNLLLMEDLGKSSLYALVNETKNIYPLYRAAIRELIKLQIDGYPDVPISDHYDYEHIKWEQDYFKTHFLHHFCGISKRRFRKFYDDLERIAKSLLRKAKPWSNFLMHRDYQSQNIYIHKRKARVIDFQSLRIGPLTYDLAALLKDSYVHLTEKQEEKLIDYYLECIKRRGIKFKKKEFMDVYRLTCLQRIMQALGAFANLTLNKRKPHFRQYIPRGLALLQSTLSKSPFGQLYEFVSYPEVHEKCRV